MTVTYSDTSRPETHSDTCDVILSPAKGEPAQQCPSCKFWVRRSRYDNRLEIISYHEKIARPRWEANQAGPSFRCVKVVEYYEGSIEIYFPVTDPASSMFGGATCETVKCGHQHTREQAAMLCVNRVAAKLIKRRNAELAAREATKADADRAFAAFDAFAAREIG